MSSEHSNMAHENCTSHVKPISVVGQTADGREGSTLAAKRFSDIIVIAEHLPLPNSMNATSEILTRFDQTLIIARSLYREKTSLPIYS